ncbi:MAG: NAD-dependent epimerase/dehydratase family protein [Pseudomonadota bacterium]
MYNLNRMHILLTGATGFVGRALAKVLVQNGCKVYATTRYAQTQFSADIQKCIFDLNDQNTYNALPTKIDGIIHLADGLAARFEKVKNCISDETLLKQVSHTIQLANWAKTYSTAKKFIYISSLKSMCGETSPYLLTETDTPNPTGNYGRAKYLAEQALQKAFQTDANALTVLRNPIVHGPGATSHMARLLKIADSPWPLPIACAKINAKRSTIGIENLCHATATTLEKKIIKSGTYIVSDDEVLSPTEILHFFRAALLREKRFIPLPHWMWSSMGQLPMLDKIANRFAKPLVVSNQAFKKDFDWKPIGSTEQSLLRMVMQYIAEQRENRSFVKHQKLRFLPKGFLNSAKPKRKHMVTQSF